MQMLLPWRGSDVDGPATVPSAAPGRLRRRAAVFVIVVAALLVPAAPAWAHAQLQATSPAGGTRLTTAPTSVTLQFSESVDVTPDAVKVFDRTGKRMDIGAARHPAVGATFAVVAPLRPRVPDGTYAVAWRVVSADGHPVTGTFTFIVGSGAAVRIATPGGADGSNAAVSVSFAVIRWAVFCGLALLIGGAVFLLLCWPGGRVDARAKRLLWGGWAAVSGASFLALALQGPYVRGEGLLQALTARSLGDTLATRFGEVLSVRLLLLGLAAMWLSALLPRVRPAFDPLPATPPAASSAASVAIGALLGLGLLFTWPATGHQAVGSQVALATPVAVAHLAAMCAWLGGLAVLSSTLITAGRAADLARALPVFSRLAFSSVVLLIVTGAYESWRQVGTLPALTGTTYGRLLLVKLVAFVALIALGNLGRRFVRRHYGHRQVAVVEAVPELALVGAARERPVTLPVPPGTSAGGGDGESLDPPPTDGLRRSVLIEVVIGIAIVALSAVLVASAPARVTYHPPFRSTLTLPSGIGQVVVTPARAGQALVDLRLYDKAGRPLPVQGVRGSLSLPSRRASDLRVRFDRVGPGHYTAPATDFPFAGRWVLAVTVRSGAADEAATTVIRIR
jgi:copper transport protein